MELMIDCETMSLAPNAAIVSIGAVLFDSHGLCPKEFSINVSLNDSMRHGLDVSADTVMWWLDQGDAARRALLFDRMPLTTALSNLRVFIMSNNNVKGVWSNGAANDLVWLRSAFTATGLDLPWSHKQERCFRTLRALLDPVDFLAPRDPSLVAHRAIDDARYQALHASAILRRLAAFEWSDKAALDD